MTATDSAGDTATVQYPISVFFTPQQISQAYGLNGITLSGGITGTGAGQTVAIVDTGDAPNLVSTTDPNFANSDLHQFDLAFGLPDPPSFTKVNEFGGTDLPPFDTSDRQKPRRTSSGCTHSPRKPTSSSWKVRPMSTSRRGTDGATFLASRWCRSAIAASLT